MEKKVILCLLSCLLFNNSGAQTVISGSYPAPTEKLYLVYSRDYPLSSNLIHVIDSVTIDAEGNFSFNINSTGPDHYLVINQRKFNILLHDLYLAPGDTFIIDFVKRDGRHFAEYKGNAAREYRFFEAYRKTFFNEDYQQVLRDIPSMTIVNFLEFMQKREDTLTALFEKEKPADSEVADYTRSWINYKLGNEYFGYLKNHNYRTKRVFDYYLADDEFYSFKEKASVESNFSFMNEYRQYIANYLHDKFERDRQHLPDSSRHLAYLSRKFNVAKSLFTGEARDIAFNSMTSDFSIRMQEDFYEMLNVFDNFYRENASRMLNYDKFKLEKQSMMRIAPGAPAPDLELPGIDGNPVCLGSFKGKVVYLNFWGSWCVPCLNDIPDKIELAEKFNKAEVIFLNVAMESGERQMANWRKLVEEGEDLYNLAQLPAGKKIPGIHVVADGQFHNPVIKPYMVNAVPTYILIDKEGKIAYTRANKPSSASEQIEKLLTR